VTGRSSRYDRRWCRGFTLCRKACSMNDCPSLPPDAETPDVAVVEDRRPSWFEGDEEEQPMGAKAGLVVMRVGGALQAYNVEHDAGDVFSRRLRLSDLPHAPRLTRYPTCRSFGRGGCRRESHPMGTSASSPTSLWKPSAQRPRRGGRDASHHSFVSVCRSSG
jgi:hypothetical protein